MNYSCSLFLTDTLVDWGFVQNLENYIKQMEDLLGIEFYNPLPMGDGLTIYKVKSDGKECGRLYCYVV